MAVRPAPLAGWYSSSARPLCLRSSTASKTTTVGTGFFDSSDCVEVRFCELSLRDRAWIASEAHEDDFSGLPPHMGRVYCCGVGKRCKDTYGPGPLLLKQQAQYVRIDLVWYAPMADAPAVAVTYGSSEAGRIPFTFSVNRPPHYWPRSWPTGPSHLARPFDLPIVYGVLMVNRPGRGILRGPGLYVWLPPRRATY